MSCRNFRKGFAKNANYLGYIQSYTNIHICSSIAQLKIHTESNAKGFVSASRIGGAHLEKEKTEKTEHLLVVCVLPDNEIPFDVVTNDGAFHVER